MTDDDIFTVESMEGAIADFKDPEQSLLVRLEKLKWGLQGHGIGIRGGIQAMESKGIPVPEEITKALGLNAAHLGFVDELILYHKGEPSPELLTESDTNQWIEDVGGYLPEPEHEHFMALLRGAALKYNKIRKHPLLELFKMLGNKSQKKLMAYAEKLERKDNK